MAPLVVCNHIRADDALFGILWGSGTFGRFRASEVFIRAVLEIRVPFPAPFDKGVPYYFLDSKRIRV